MIEVYDIIGHLSYIFILFGNISVGKKKKFGWILRLLGEVGWLGIGVYLGITSVWMWGVVFVYIDIMNWRKWRKHEISVQA